MTPKRYSLITAKKNEMLRWKSFWQRRVDTGNEIPDALVTAITAVSKEEFPNIYIHIVYCLCPSNYQL